MHTCGYDHVNDRIRPAVHPRKAQMVLHQQMFKGVWFICSVLGHSSQGLILMGLAKGGQWNVVQGHQNRCQGQHQTVMSPGQESDWDQKKKTD